MFQLADDVIQKKTLGKNFCYFPRRAAVHYIVGLYECNCPLQHERFFVNENL